MRIAIFVNTPAQFHFYKNIAKKLNEQDNDVLLLFRDYGETLNLVKESRVKGYIYSRRASSKYGKVLSLTIDIAKAVNLLRKFKPHVITGFGVYDSFSSLFTGTPCIVFSDSEPQCNPLFYSVQYIISTPLANAIITPEFYRYSFGEKHIRVASFKELAYLHPNYYTCLLYTSPSPRDRG